MSLNLHEDLVKEIVILYESGRTPDDIRKQLAGRGYTRLSLLTIKQCLRLKGYPIDTDDANNNPPLSTPVETLINKPWDAEADAYALKAYFLGKSVVKIWVELRWKYGYDATKAQVVASLVAQGVPEPA